MEIGSPVSLQGELLSMAVLVIAAYLIGWIWLKLTTLPALIGMLLTGILFQNLNLVTMTDQYRQLNQDLRFVVFVANTSIINQLTKHYETKNAKINFVYC